MEGGEILFDTIIHYWFDTSYIVIFYLHILTFNLILFIYIQIIQQTNLHSGYLGPVSIIIR